MGCTHKRDEGIYVIHRNLTPEQGVLQMQCTHESIHMCNS